MKEFFIQYYSIITHGVEILAAVTGLFFYKRYKKTAAKYFIYFLIYVCIIDLLGQYPNLYDDYELLSVIQNSRFKYNYWLLTSFYILGSILFFLFYYYKIVKKKIFKKVIVLVGFSSLLFSFVYIILNAHDFFIKFLPIISVVASISILTYSTIYFVELLMSDKVLKFYRDINFYITIGLFFWWLITTPVVFYGVYNSESDWDFVFLKWQIFLFANIFMYTTFTIGLIVSKPEASK